MPKQPETKVKFSIFNKEFNDGLREIDNESKKLRKEFKLQEEQLKENGSASDILSNKINRLSTEQEQTRRKIQATEEQLASAKKYYGDNSKEAETLSNKLLDLRISEQKLQNAIKNTKDDLQKQGKEMQDTAKDAQNLKDSMKDASKSMAGIGTGTAIGAGALVNGMQDYNEILARLRTNAATSGRDLGVVEDAFNRIVTVTGEADSAGETIANLLASGISDEQLKNSIDDITGAYINFSDTLKTEGIADGLQETLATGKAVGPFAELLERSGVNIDHFNSTLSSMKAVGKDTDYVMQTLADLGLSKTYDKYKELNPEVQQNAEANAELQQASADLALALTPLVAKVTEIIAKVTAWASNNPPLTKTILIIVTVIGTLIGIGMALVPVFLAITAASVPLAASIWAITWPILAIVAVIAALIAIGVLLYRNWDTIKAKTVEIWGFIKVFLSKIWESIKTTTANVWNGIKNFFAKWWDEILALLTGPIGMLVYLIVHNWDSIKNATLGVWNGIKSFFIGFWESIKVTFSNRVNTIKNTLSSVWNAIKNVTLSVWNGIKSAITNPIESAKNTVLRIIDKIKGAFNFKWELPKLKVPSVSVEMKKNSWGIPYPDFDISWHKTGGVFTDPVIAGNAGFGDVEEGIVPFEGSHAMKIAKLIASAQNKLSGVSNSLVDKVVNNIVQVEVEAGDVIMDGRSVGKVVWRPVQEEMELDSERNKRVNG